MPPRSLRVPSKFSRPAASNSSVEFSQFRAPFRTFGTACKGCRSNLWILAMPPSSGGKICKSPAGCLAFRQPNHLQMVSTRRSGGRRPDPFAGFERVLWAHWIARSSVGARLRS
jgi:hypothetical protein